MDCSVCTTMPLILRPPRNTICGACYEGARTILNMMNKLESDKTMDNPNHSLPSPSHNSSKASSWSSSHLYMLYTTNFIYSTCSYNFCNDFNQNKMFFVQSLSAFKRWYTQQLDQMDEHKHQVAFLESFVDAFKLQIHTDITVTPGNHGPPIPSHKAVLVSTNYTHTCLCSWTSI